MSAVPTVTAANPPTSRTPALDRWRSLLAFSALLLPPIAFYGLLFAGSTSLPFGDDYEALLGFANGIYALRGFPAKFMYFLASQHNEYKLFFEHAVVWIELALTGRINFQLLCALGNGFVLALAGVLWKMFLPDKPLRDRLILFIPISCLVFQLQYVETLDWAMTGLSNIPVLVFSIAAMHLLVQPRKRSYFYALCCLIGAIASVGNGLFVIPIGAVILLLRRRMVRLAAWAAVSGLGCAAYFYRYNFHDSQSEPHYSIIRLLLHPRPVFFLNFIGGALAVQYGFLVVYVLLCPVLGIALCAFFFAMARRGYFRRRPAVGYSIIFLLITAIFVSGLRGNLPIRDSFTSRYGIYSALLLVFAWFAIAEEFLPQKRWLLPWTISLCLLFTIVSDIAGRRYLSDGNRERNRGMMAFERSSANSPVPRYRHQNARADELDAHAHDALLESIRNGIYDPRH
jgi:hypothetical protein